MTTADLIAHLLEIAERVSHDDRFVIFEAVRRIKHGAHYVER